MSDYHQSNDRPEGVQASYIDPENPALPKSSMKLNIERAALVVIDPQVDFMSPEGASWPFVGESVTEQRLVPNLIRLFEASKRARIPVVISPHYYYPHDHKWQFEAPAETLQHDLRMFDRCDPLTLDGFAGSGAEFMPEFKSFINDGYANTLDKNEGGHRPVSRSTTSPRP